MAKFDPKVLNALNTTFKDLITNKDNQSEEISRIVLTCFTYLLIALGIIMLLKLYFQTVFIFAKYFPIVTLPLYVFGAWAFSALLFYMAWDMGFEPDDNGAAQQHIMKETFATCVHQGLIVGAVFLMIAPFTLLMPRLRFGRSSSDNEGCCRTICFPTFVWVVFLFIVLLAVFSGYCLYMLLIEYYQQSFFNSIGVEGIYVLIVLFYLFALFQILAQRKIIVSGENILGELRKPFKCLHSRPYLFVYISVLIFFSLAALGVTAFYGVKAFDVYKAAEGVEARTTNIAIVGAFSGMAAVYVLIGMALGLVISCSSTAKSENAAGYPSQTQPLNASNNEYDGVDGAGRNQPYATHTENTVMNDRSSYQQREYNDYNMENNTLDSRNNTLQYNDGSMKSGTLELKAVNQSPKTVTITMQHSDGSKSNLGAIRAFPHTTLADARILTRTLPNAPQNYVFITRNREVSESQEAEFTIYGLEELILAVETVC